MHYEKDHFDSGGAGFIGTNTANYYLKKGEAVIVFDNFHRNGTKENSAWLKSKFSSLEIAQGGFIRI